MNSNKNYIDAGHYKTLQEALDVASNHDVIQLPSGIYTEKLMITKTVTIIGDEDTVLKLDKHQIILKGTVEVVFKNIHFEIKPRHYDAAIMVYDATLTCISCQLTSKAPHRDLFSCIWVEKGSFLLIDSVVNARADLIKIIKGETFEMNHNELRLKGGQLSVEAHGMKYIKIFDNNIHSSVNFMRCTRTVNFICEKNHMKTSIQLGSNNPVFLDIDGLDHGDDFIISDNIINVVNTATFSVSNSLSINRKIMFTNNQIMGNDDSTSTVKFHHLQGILVIENNQLLKSELTLSKCSELMLKQNEIMLMSTQHLNLLMAIDNRFSQHVMIDGAQRVNFKKNTIINDRADCEAIKFNAVDKLVFDQNKISSVDHGFTLLNAGDNLEIFIQNNEFLSCRKRAINIASTMQKKYLKTEVHISKNLFIQNDRAVHIDDKNLKACSISENYFGDNKEAVVVLGGSSTSNIKVSGNYFDASNQRIEIRSSQVCSLSHNELSDSKVNVRGCDEIIINGNHIEKYYFAKGQSQHNEVSIKSGGCLTVSHNVMLNGKLRHEKKEVYEHLNITSYERHPAVNIYENQPLVESGKRKLFETNVERRASLYPDESLQSAIKYLIHSDLNFSEMEIDDVLKADFFKLHEALENIHKNITSERLQNIITSIIEQFQIEIFVGRDTNDIYRFIVKSNETVEMLRIYTTLVEETSMATEERIIAVMNNYVMIFNQFLNQNTEDEQDKLNAQLKLLENLL